MRVIVLDDNAALRQALVLAAEANGHGVVEARTAWEAIAQLDDDAHDLLVADLGVPGGGLVAVRHAVEHWPTVRVVVFSGARRPDGLPASVRFAQKPLSPFELLLSAEAWVAGH